MLFQMLLLPYSFNILSNLLAKKVLRVVHTFIELLVAIATVGKQKLIQNSKNVLIYVIFRYCDIYKLIKGHLK